MGPAKTAIVLLLLTVLTTGALTAGNSTNTTSGPIKVARVPKLDRAAKSKLLVEVACELYCKNVFWQIKRPTETTWKTVEAQAHDSFPDTFYIRGLRPDTSYHLRALLRPNASTPPYDGDDVPVLEARTCPDRPPPLRNLVANSAGPGWLDLRWQPADKEECKSHLFYQLRYAPQGEYFSAWRSYGYFRSSSWVHFRPTHPCAPWPDRFCVLLTDNVKPGELHIVEVRVSRFDELVPSVSESRRLMVVADTACINAGTCGVIGGAPPTPVNATPNSASAASAASVTRAPATDDSDLRAETATATATATAEDVDFATATASAEPPPLSPARRYKGRSGDSTFGRLSPFFLAMLLLTVAALPAAYIIGRRRGARQASGPTRLATWKRDSLEGCSQPVLVDCDGQEAETAGSGTFSWTKMKS